MIYEPRPRPLSEALAAMPDLRNRLLADHVPDASGHRCRACTTPGTAPRDLSCDLQGYASPCTGSSGSVGG